MTIKKKVKADDSQDHGYRNLADKYRPVRIDDLIGANHLKPLLNSLLSRKKTPNAILLYGPTGSGKTTLARMVARYLNCVDRTACGKCPSCKAMIGPNPSHPDYNEINAGSARGIDDMRKQVAASRYQPTNRVRVIMLDEAHRCTPDALQLLLKESEEPPPHTLWMLGTTNPEKLPTTLINRALKLPTRQAEPKELAAHLINVAKKEGFKPDKEGEAVKILNDLAEMVGGSQREAMMALDQALSGGTSLVKQLKDWQAAVDVQPDLVAVKILYSLFKGKLALAARAVYDCEHNPRAAMYKLRFLCDNMIRDTLKAPGGFRDTAFRMFKEQMVKRNITIDANGLRLLVTMQLELSNAEWRMNQGAPEVPTLIGAILTALNSTPAAKGKDD